jgi:hypothetical protein
LIPETHLKSEPWWDSNPRLMLPYRGRCFNRLSYQGSWAFKVNF